MLSWITAETWAPKQQLLSCAALCEISLLFIIFKATLQLWTAQTALSIQATASHEGSTTFYLSKNMPWQRRKICLVATWTQPRWQLGHQTYLSFVHNWKKPFLSSAPTWLITYCAQLWLCLFLFCFLLSVEILIIIIGRLRKGAINISSAATE